MIQKLNSRRDFIRQTGLGMGGLILSSALVQCRTELNQNIKQVIAAWPFMATGPKWSPEEFLRNVSSLGAVDVELFPVAHWNLLKKYNMICAATKSHTFVRGMNNKNHHAECFESLQKAMEATSAAGFPNVMTFTGLSDTTSEKNGSIVSKEEGFKNCIEGYKKMVHIAEKKNVTLILEPLNSKATEHMKGHPGYQGDHIDYCIEIIKAVGSPALKLLFDVYHVQIMDGNLIANINKYIDYIAHVQVAGNPGRGEIGDTQEINYRAVMQAFYNNGYKGYIGHEWIPTGDPIAGLREAIQICDI
jgi:hydroxypyruvate isomerase